MTNQTLTVEVIDMSNPYVIGDIFIPIDMPFLVIAASHPIKLKNHFSGYQTITVSDNIHNDKPVSEDKSLTAYKRH